MCKEYITPFFKVTFGFFNNKKNKGEYVSQNREHILVGNVFIFFLLFILFVCFGAGLLKLLFLISGGLLCFNSYYLKQIEDNYVKNIKEEEEEYQNYYNFVLKNLKVLGIDIFTTDVKEIKKAYKILMLKYHPDRITGNEEKAKEVNTAYEELKRLLEFN